LGCGLKRGFSYFHQPRHQPFVPDPQHRNELLVAAKAADDETSDTQWLRADVDAFLAGEAAAAGIRLFEGVRLAPPVRHPEGGWQLRSEPEGLAVHVRFVIDGTGEASVMARATVPSCGWNGSRPVRGCCSPTSDHVGAWDEGGLRLAAATVESHPFHCDDAAQHMLLLDGPGCGCCVSKTTWQASGWRSTNADFRSTRRSRRRTNGDWLPSHPSVGELLADVELAAVPGRMIRTGRIQRQRPWRGGGRGLGRSAQHGRLHRSAAQHGHRPLAVRCRSGSCTSWANPGHSRNSPNGSTSTNGSCSARSP
jgi:FADH2 O2-dependent halogenase